VTASYDGARTLGHYQLLSQLAVGGMAEIYVAKTAGVSGFEKLVALKVIHPNFSADPDFVQMLVDEAKLSVQLQHANIVQTFDLGRVDDQYYIAMELIDGVDLYKLLRRASDHEIDFPFEVAAFICGEVCAGLDYAHRKRDSRGRPLQIVHRDVSPQNVLVSFDGEVKIVDFGIAKAAMRSQNTAAGVIKGKYYYMSPEQASGDPIDLRTDIFSAGILLYEMIVGQMLYLEEDLDKLLEIVRRASIAPPSSKRMGVPRELEAVLMRALKKRADDRWPTAGELSTALTQFMHGFAPDFNRSRLAGFVREVMGDDPTAQRRDPRAATAMARGGEVDFRDENSLLFRLRNPPKRAETTAPAPSPAPAPPRRADVATNVGPARPATQPSEFEESDATIVDAKAEAMALAHEGNKAPSGQFDLGVDDPARDLELNVPVPGVRVPGLEVDEDDVPTGARPLPRLHATRQIETPRDDDEAELGPSLPGVVQRQPRLTPMGKRGVAVPAQDDEDTGERFPPTRELARVPRPSDPNSEDGSEDGGFADRAAPPPARATPVPAPRAPTPPMGNPRSPSATPPAGNPRSPSGAQPISKPPPPVSDAAATLTLPPSANPIAHSAAAPSQPNKPGPPTKQSFDEPTRIPPAQPPPIDSGQQWPIVDGNFLFGSPLADPADARPRRGKRSPLIYVAGGGAALVTAIVLGVFTLGGDSARGTLSIVSLPTGAEVRVDGNASAQPTPLTLADIDPRQTHHLRVSKSGYDVWESDVRFPAGERRFSVQAVLMPAVGTVEITSTPSGAEAIVNGRIRGTTPTTVGDLPPNDDVVIELRLRGYKVAHRSVSWPRNGTNQRLIQLSIPLEKAK
jgi:serine/threonine-protein kinase